MDKTFGASCWLLLVLSAQRNSSAPIPAEGVRSSGVEVPDTETLISPPEPSEEDALKSTGSVKDVRITYFECGEVDSGSDVHIPAELETDEVDQMGQAAGATTQKDVVVHVDSAGEALNSGDREAVFISLSQINKTSSNVSKVLEEVDAGETSLVDREEQEAKAGNAENHAEEEEEALDPIMLEGPTTDEEALPGGTEKEDNLVFVSVESETEEDTTPDKSGQEDPEAAGPVESEREDFLLPRVSTEVEEEGEGEEDIFQTNTGEGVQEETDEEDFRAAAHFVDLTNAAVSAAVSRKADSRLNIQSQAPVSSVQEAPVALVNRGAILRVALLTLTSLIVVGFVGMTISKKLR